MPARPLPGAALDPPACQRPAGVHPPLDSPGYRSTALRHPREPLVRLPHGLTEITGSEGRYRFVTIKPGAYPWGNHYNAWRPAHIHFSLFGRAFTQRLVTQMYFPGDPLFAQDPIFNSVPDAAARQRMICRFDLSITQPEWALGYEWDIVLRGREAAVFEREVAW
jgi:protocatechuate 3,4-dioxygenase beta subunit